MCAKFVSLKASYSLIRHTRIPDLGRWIIYPESTKNSYRILKKYKYKRYKLRTKQGLSLTGLTNRIFLHTNKKKYFAHRIHSSTLWSSEKLPVQNTQSASCPSSSVESSAKGTVRSVSESDSVRRSWIPANPSLPSFWRTKKSIRRKPIGFGFSGLLDFFLSCPNKISVIWTRYFLYSSITRI